MIIFSDAQDPRIKIRFYLPKVLIKKCFMKRSTFLQNSAAIIGGSLLPSSGFSQPVSKPGKIRFAFLTDIHVKPELVAETGMAKAFHHAQSLKSKVNFIINGGDCIWDSLEADKQKTQAQWDL